MTGFPEIMCPEVRLAFQALSKALDAAVQAKGVTLCDVALCWHAQHDGRSGVNCIFSEGMTPDVAESFAGVLMMDAEDAEFDEVLAPVRHQ